MQHMVEQLTLPVHGMAPVPVGDEREAAWAAYLAQEVRKLCPDPKPVTPATRVTLKLVFLVQPEQMERVSLENLAQPVFDILFKPRYVRTEYASLTGTLFQVGYERIFKLALEKRSVATEVQAGVEITVTWE